MRVLVTGAHGKVGSAAVEHLASSGLEVTASDLARPVYEAPADGTAVSYVQADLTDAGDAFAVVRGHDVVVHAAAIPEPSQNVAHHVFRNNLMATFNALEAAVRFGARRFVFVSSETVPGFVFAERPLVPEYAPIDEEHPARPQDPYALAKLFGEQLCDAAIARSDLRCTTVRPSWVQWEGNVARNLGPYVRDGSLASESLWSWTDAYDLAESLRLAITTDLPGHEVFYVVGEENTTGRPLADLVREHHGDEVPVRGLSREDAGGTSCAKARRLLGYVPRRRVRDYLDDAGELAPEPAGRLARGETGVQAGRRRLGLPAT